MELATGRPPMARVHPMRVLMDTIRNPPPSLEEAVDGRVFSQVGPAMAATSCNPATTVTNATAAVDPYDLSACAARSENQSSSRRVTCGSWRQWLTTSP